jgi:hypothetical protein
MSDCVVTQSRRVGNSYQIRRLVSNACVIVQGHQNPKCFHLNRANRCAVGRVDDASTTSFEFDCVGHSCVCCS